MSITVPTLAWKSGVRFDVGFFSFGFGLLFPKTARGKGEGDGGAFVRRVGDVASRRGRRKVDEEAGRAVVVDAVRGSATYGQKAVVVNLVISINL